MELSFFTLRANRLSRADFEDYSVFERRLVCLVEAARKCGIHWTVEIPFTIAGEESLVNVSGSLIFNDFNVEEDEGVSIDTVHYQLNKQLVGAVYGSPLDVFLNIQGLAKSID